jgi:hypothetical protein
VHPTTALTLRHSGVADILFHYTCLHPSIDIKEPATRTTSVISIAYHRVLFKIIASNTVLSF